MMLKIIRFSLFSFVLLSFFAFIQPEVSYSQLACCITAGGQCNPGCGPEGTSCQFDGPPGPPCNGDYQLGQSCYQVANNQGECQPIGCCETSDGTFIQTTEGTCEFNGGACMPPPPSGCCETLNPTECNETTAAECSGNFTVGASCATPTSCGEPPPPVDGCCQTQVAVCVDTTDANCLDSPFFPGGMCMDGGETFCESPPVGCCVIEQGVCKITTEEGCNNQDGDYQGDDTDCAGNPMCMIPSNVPTLSQWGLIAMAGILGIVGLIMLRRKRAII